MAGSLRHKGCEEFLPLYRQKRRWSDRTAEVDLPLFPGYVFSRFDVQERLPILMIPGVMHVVGIGKAPLAVDDREIEALRLLVSSQLPLEPWPFRHIGRPVRIVSGPLAGAEGLLESVKARQRLVVSVTILQRSVAVEVFEDNAWPISPLDMPLLVS